LDTINNIKELIHSGNENFELGIILAKNLNMYDYINTYYKDLVAISGKKLKDLVNLTSINLTTSIIPKCIIDFTKIKKLSVRTNKDVVLELPKNFENLKKLDYIYLQGFEVPNDCLLILQSLPNIKQLKIT
jgi:hypothetical protein